MNTHAWQCRFTSVVELDALVRLLGEFVKDVECYCGDNPTWVCPVHEAQELLRQNDVLARTPVADSDAKEKS